MISVFLSFIYIGITTFLSGFAIRLLARKLIRYEISNIYSIFFGGLAVVTVYAGFFSLVSGVGMIANGIMLLGCIVILVVAKDELFSYIKACYEGRKKGKLIFAFFLILLFAFGASRGYIHFDTGLYHAQAIRWIEEYGVVPGLANLHCRLAYNSSSFVLTALYSLEFLTGNPLHTVSGFMALILAFQSFSVVDIFKRKKVFISDFVKVASLFYLSIIFTEMISPASDYFAMIFLFFIVIRWTELEEQGEKEAIGYSLLCVLLVVNVSIKLSAAIMLLLVLKPAYLLLKKRQYQEIGVFLLLGSIAVFPYLARNVILSGWLIYPFPAIDLFSFDWEIPAMEALYDSEEIKVYAKGMTDVLLKDLSIGEWLPGWFKGLKGLEKLWVFSSLLSIPLMLVSAIFALTKRKREYYGMLYLGTVMIAGYIFWQIGAPLVRYGYIYILAFPFFVAGLWFKLIFKNHKRSLYIFAVLLVLFFLYKGINLARTIVDTADENYYIMQKEYYTGPYEVYELQGIEFYVPTDRGQIGYGPFPSMPHIREDVELRDGTLKGGFRRV